MVTKHLFRSTKNKVLGGVCGGVGEYFNIDAVLIRIIWLLVVVFTGVFPGVLAYIIALFIVPLEPHHVHHQEHTAE